MNSKSVIITVVIVGIAVVGITASTMQENETVDEIIDNNPILNETQSDEGKEFSLNLKDGITTSSP